VSSEGVRRRTVAIAHELLTDDVLKVVIPEPSSVEGERRAYGWLVQDLALELEAAIEDRWNEWFKRRSRRHAQPPAESSADAMKRLKRDNPRAHGVLSGYSPAARTGAPTDPSETAGAS